MQRPQRRPTSLPTPYEEAFLDITDYRFMEEVEDPDNDELGPECTGIVLHSLFGGADQVLSALYTLCFDKAHEKFVCFMGMLVESCCDRYMCLFWNGVEPNELSHACIAG